VNAQVPEAGAPKAPVFLPDANGATDSRANEEAMKFATGSDLEVDGRRQEHVRHQKFRNHVNIATLILFWLIAGSIGVGVLVFTWHLVTPVCWHFLDSESRDKLQTILGAAVLSSALTGYVNKRMAA
jgi:hypothetical protein